eukprot:767371-Hanusia_phi.AAC.4
MEAGESLRPIAWSPSSAGCHRTSAGLCSAAGRGRGTSPRPPAAAPPCRQLPWWRRTRGRSRPPAPTCASPAAATPEPQRTGPPPARGRQLRETRRAACSRDPSSPQRMSRCRACCIRHAPRTGSRRPRDTPARTPPPTSRCRTGKSH